MAEDFGKLLEHYLTGSLDKYYSDFDYIDTPSKKKKRVTFEDDQYIDMNTFVENIYRDSWIVVNMLEE